MTNNTSTKAHLRTYIFMAALWGSMFPFFSFSQNTSKIGKRLPDIFNADYEIIGNEIFVKALINGDTALFMFDTGAPSLMINKDYFGKGFFADSSMNGYSVKISSFQWNGIQWDNFETPTIEDRQSKFPIKYAGLLGYDIYKDYEIMIDLPQHKIIFCRTDSSGNVIKKIHLNNKKTISVVPVQLIKGGHTIVFDMTIGSKTYSAIFDTGAGINGISADVFDFKDTVQLNKDFVTAGSKNYTIKKGKTDLFFIKEAKVGKGSFKDMLFRSSDWYFNKKNFGVDAIVGYDFIKQHAISINYRKRELCIYE